ncbi:MAG: transcription antitermination factor NusB [Prevotellaceae bacterium]|jgi:N utilization substance protein B|nr:transcription antitermination factor NusB [Prevotellaceae bacterium]
MLTRALLRTKAMQVLYANFQTENNVLTMQNELNFSMQKAYDLYHFLLLLPIEITKMAKKSVKLSTKKLLKNKEDYNPDTKLAENDFAFKLSENKLFNKYVEKNKISWIPYQEQLQNIFSIVKETVFYKEYIDSTEASFVEDKKFWQKFFKSKEIFNEKFDEFLEDLSIYWLDDANVVLSFLEQTVRFYKPDVDDKENIEPLFKDQSDKIFIRDLAQVTFENSEDYDRLIKTFLSSWDLERLTKIDIVLIKMAIAEFKTFPEIPVSVTLNEYIEIAKFYGTYKSRIFINGILDNIVKRMRQTSTLNKLNELSINKL